MQKIKSKVVFLLSFFTLSASLLVPKASLASEACSITTLDCLSPQEPTFWLVTSTAMVDAINPCAIAVLIFLLSALLFFKDKKKVLKTGLAFILGLYITYLAFGLGLFYILRINTWINPDIFHIVMGSFAIIVGLLNIKDFFWYGGGGFLMEIPRKWRPKMSLIIAKATSVPVAFLVGILVTAFELPCTGGPYVFILGVLSQGISKALIAPILVYYNLIFVLPLLIILFGVYFGFVSVEKTDHWKQRNIRLLHLVAGAILVALGLWVIFS